MPEKTGRASNFGKVREGISGHRMEGWRSIRMLRKAGSFHATLKVLGDSIRVRTVLVNRGAGHTFPGGSPLRQLVVKIKGLDDSGRTLFEDDSLRYGVEFEIPEGDTLNVWEARSVVRDRRIQPGEKRVGMRRLPLLAGLQKVEVGLFYYPIPLEVIEARELEMEPVEIYHEVIELR